MKAAMVIAMVTVVISRAALALSEKDASALADVIYRVEGGDRARVPYGILGVKVRSRAHAREICLRTIWHAWRDCPEPKSRERFIRFLGNRYCPPSADPVGNRNWIRNVILISSGLASPGRCAGG